MFKSLMELNKRNPWVFTTTFMLLSMLSYDKSKLIAISIYHKPCLDIN